PDPEEDPGERRGIESPAQVEPVRDDRLDDEATGERVKPEERRELRDGPGGAVDTEEAALPLDVRELDPVRKRKEDREVGEADERVQDEKRAIRIGARETVRREESDRGRRERAERAREVRRHVVDREEPGAALVRRGLREHGLFDGLEHTDLGARRADRPGERAD